LNPTPKMTTMRIKYEGLDRETYSVDLREIKVKGILIHATPDDNIDSIKRDRPKTKMPRTKLLVDVDAIFCTIPSKTLNTADLFRYYDDWNIVVIDTDKIPDHKWYIDFLGEDDISNNGQNKHVMTFEDIPAIAIKKVIK